MANYDWRCGACEQTVPAGHSACVRCGCPEDASRAEVDQHFATYEISDAMRAKSAFRCSKCDHHLHVSGEIRSGGGFFSSALEVATEKFKYIACRRCGFTEFYRADLSVGSQVADLLLG